MLVCLFVGSTQAQTQALSKLNHLQLAISQFLFQHLGKEIQWSCLPKLEFDQRCFYFLQVCQTISTFINDHNNWQSFFCNMFLHLKQNQYYVQYLYQYKQIYYPKTMSSNKTCYYQILEVEKSADLDQIKKSYKKLAMKWHPDKNPNDIQHAKQKFRQISQAYQVLSDSEKRLNYDKYGFEGPKSKGFSGFGFDDADNLFKSFFKTAGFDNHDDEDFFSSIFKAHGIKGGLGGFGGFSGFGRMEGFGRMPNLKSKFSMLDDDDFFKNSFSKNGMFGEQPKFGSGYGLTRSQSTTTKMVDGKQITTKKITVFKDDGSQEITEETIEGDKKVKKIYSLGASEIEGMGKKSVKNY